MGVIVECGGGGPYTPPNPLLRNPREFIRKNLDTGVFQPTGESFSNGLYKILKELDIVHSKKPIMVSSRDHAFPLTNIEEFSRRFRNPETYNWERRNVDGCTEVRIPRVRLYGAITPLTISSDGNALASISLTTPAYRSRQFN